MESTAWLNGGLYRNAAQRIVCPHAGSGAVGVMRSHRSVSKVNISKSTPHRTADVKGTEMKTGLAKFSIYDELRYATRKKKKSMTLSKINFQKFRKSEIAKR